MNTENKNQSRRRFIGWGFASAAFFSAAKFMLPSRKKKETVKMLTQDGRLVEIDRDMIPRSKRKITDPELKVWVKSNSAKN